MLKNELKYMGEPPNFDTLNASELLLLHKEVVGKPVESITNGKKKSRIVVMDMSSSSVA